MTVLFRAHWIEQYDYGTSGLMIARCDILYSTYLLLWLGYFFANVCGNGCGRSSSGGDC